MASAADALLDAVLDSIEELAVLVDPRGRIAAFNRACEALTGYRHDEVRGKDLVESFVPGDWQDAVRRRFADPRAAQVREPHENPWRTRSGEERLIRWRCTPVEVPGEESPFILGLGTDVSGQSRLDAQWRAQSRLMETFFESTLACAVILDRDFNFVRVNKAYAEACARDVAEFAGRNHFEMFPSEARAIFEEVVRTRRPFCAHARPFEFPDHPEWGTTYWDWLLAPVLDDRGEVETLVFCLHDVTASQHNAERLKRALTAMQTLSHRLARAREAERRRLALELHDDMGQELTGLKLALESLREAAPDDARLCKAMEITTGLQARVRSISTHLRPPMLEDLGLRAALPWLFERKFAGAGLEVSFRHSGLEERLPAEVETAVYRATQEALTNVVRHAGVYSATVIVRATTDIVVLKVEDTGKGFDPERIATSGDGIGLAGMSERIRGLGGRLAIESAPGMGTTLTAELPLPGALTAPGAPA